MARMHARRKGISGSTHPIERTVPDWSLKSKEIEDLIVKMAEEGKTPAMIGLTLRDSYGIPDVRAALNKKISKVLKEHNISPEIPEDLNNLLDKKENLEKHLASNTRDIHNRHRLKLIDAKINRLVRYYKNIGRLPEKWRHV